MKHAVKQRKPAVKPKTKSLASVKAVTKPKPATKKTSGKAATDQRLTKSIQKTEPTVKPASKTAKVAAKSLLKKPVPNLTVKNLNALKTIATKKAKLAVTQIEQPKMHKTASKLSAKSAKAPTTKIPAKQNKDGAATTKLAAKPKNASVETKIVKLAKKQSPTLKTAVRNTVKTVKIPAKSNIKSVKPQIAKTIVQKTSKSNLPAAKTASTAKIKLISQKTKQPAKPKKLQPIEKAKLIAAKPIVAKKLAASIVKTKTTKQKPKKIQIVAPKKASKNLIADKPNKATKKIALSKIVVKSDKVVSIAKPEKVAVEQVEFTPVAATENIVWKRLKFKPAIVSAKAAKEKQKAKKSIVAEKIEPIAVVQEIKPLPKQKKGKPIGSAVFRGKKDRYDFKVFALNDIFDPIPAVYIISKRKTDRNKRGHHSLVCIGQTVSILDELKRHRKGKCVKKHAANVVSILPEADETMRLKIETDLKAAHTVVCNIG